MERPGAGIDWASEEDALCVVDAAGGRLAEGMLAHEEAGVRELIDRMRRGVGRVAIERPDGLLVDRLLEAGVTVLPVHPNAPKATRPRHEAAGGKSDGFDAFVLAEPARTDSHRLRALCPDSDETKALRAPTRTREALAADAGMAPVAREPGKRKVATLRRACDKRSRDAASTLANSTRHTHPRARKVHLDARAGGLEHPHAIRVLGRAWLRVLRRRRQDEVPHDPARHGDLRRLQPVGG